MQNDKTGICRKAPHYRVEVNSTVSPFRANPQVSELLLELSACVGRQLQVRSWEDLLQCAPTPVDQELHMMAACLAYFKVCINALTKGVALY